MIAQQDSELILNIVPVAFSAERVVVGRMPDPGKEEYERLRDVHWRTHAFRFDSRTSEVLNVAIVPDVEPIGQRDDVNINEHLLLLARAVQQNILVWLSRSLPIIRGDKKLIFWGQAESAALLSRAAEKVNVERVAGLEVALRYEIDCRMFRSGDDQFYLGLVIDLATSNIIDVPVSELRKKGLNVEGYYVCRRQEPENEYLRPRLELLGQISEVRGNKLLLTESESVDEIEAGEALLEPRQEYINDVIKLYYGSKASDVLTALDGFRKPVGTAAGKLARIRETVQLLRKRTLRLADSISVTFGELLDPADDRFPARVTTERPMLLFGSQGRNRGPYPDASVSEHGPYMYMQHERNAPLIGVICESRYRGRVEQFVQLLLNGYPDELWHNERRANPFPEGLVGKYRLSKVRTEFEECSNPTPDAYREAASRLLNRLPETPDLAIVQIRENFVRSYGNANPYFVSKSVMMTAGVPVQAIRIENIASPNESLAFLLNNISLATYAKLDGIPWVMSTYRPTTHEIVVGLSSAETSLGRLGTKTRYVGITSVFQGDGRYLVWGLTREVEFENYADALLQSLQAIVRYVQQQNSWQRGDRVRLVCHVYKPLRDCEVGAIKNLVLGLTADRYQVEFAFLDISWHHSYRIFAPRQQGETYWDFTSRARKVKGKGVPPRGMCLQLDDKRALLHLAGPKEVKSETQGLPAALLVELHRDSDFTDMTYLLRQVFNFTYMSWRGFFPATEPVTMTYSRLIAKLLGNLRAVPDWNSQVLSVGSLRDRRWFL